MEAAGHRITTAAENPLCGRLKNKYSVRMAAACNPEKKVNTVKRPVTKTQAAVRNIATPFENTVEFVPAVAKTAKFAKAQPTPAASRRTADVRTDAARRRVAAYEKTTPFKTGAYSKAYSRAAQIRARAYDGAEAKASAHRENSRKKAAEKASVFSKHWFPNLLAGRKDEVKVKSEPISKSKIVAIILSAAVLLMIIFSLSELNSFKNDISELEDKKIELNSEAAQLYLDIDRKNDVKKIEQIATEDIGMVKSNQVQSKYISLSAGDRVEIINGENGDATDYGVFSTLLSTFGNNWDTLRDYID